MRFLELAFLSLICIILTEFCAGGFPEQKPTTGTRSLQNGVLKSEANLSAG